MCINLISELRELTCNVHVKMCLILLDDVAGCLASTPSQRRRKLAKTFSTLPPFLSRMVDAVVASCKERFFMPSCIQKFKNPQTRHIMAVFHTSQPSKLSAIFGRANTSRGLKDRQLHPHADF